MVSAIEISVRHKPRPRLLACVNTWKPIVNGPSIIFLPPVTSIFKSSGRYCKHKLMNLLWRGYGRPDWNANKLLMLF